MNAEFRRWNAETVNISKLQVMWAKVIPAPLPDDCISYILFEIFKVNRMLKEPKSYNCIVFHCLDLDSWRQSWVQSQTIQFYTA